MKRQDFQTVLDRLRSGETAELTVEAEGTSYLRAFRPGERLLLLGGGHIAQPLCGLAAKLGFSVFVADDRPEFSSASRFPEAKGTFCADFPTAIHTFGVRERDYVAVITRGHRCDAQCLRTLLPGTMPKYLGMIGSQRRTAALLALLKEEGFDPARLAAIRTPIGLPIGALTPQEIAVSIAAELIFVRRAGAPRHGEGQRLVNEDVDLKTLTYLAEDSSPKALALVLETSGSTPAKSGSLMAVDAALRITGTIGGGCGENAAAQAAFRLIGTGESRLLTVRMDHDVAADEGMVCGGNMLVFLSDIT
ncbi:MAG: XdhC family protein [Oscillospiraceae bacterium]|nr:XdhC family protein [Oscillospiraceae bacterium]